MADGGDVGGGPTEERPLRLGDEEKKGQGNFYHGCITLVYRYTKKILDGLDSRCIKHHLEPSVL